jgi:hypothetical protein
MYGIIGREITKYTVIYGIYRRFCPTQDIIVIGMMCTQGHLLLCIQAHHMHAQTCAKTHTHTHARTHARTRSTQTHTHMHIHLCPVIAWSLASRPLALQSLVDPHSHTRRDTRTHTYNHTHAYSHLDPVDAWSPATRPADFG